MPTGTSVPISQDWGSVNVGRGTLTRSNAVPKSAREIDAAKAAGKIATAKK